MSVTTEPSSPPTSLQRPPATIVERLGWLPIAFLALVMTVFGAGAYLTDPDRGAEIFGSACCTGHRFTEVAPWAFDYTGEIARYMATYMFTSGVLFLVIALVGLRRHARWAWFTGWLMPALFAVHAFGLGAGAFDVVTMSISLLGLALLARPVLASRRVS